MIRGGPGRGSWRSRARAAATHHLPPTRHCTMGPPWVLQRLTAASRRLLAVLPVFVAKSDKMFQTFPEVAISLWRVRGAARSHAGLQVREGGGGGSSGGWWVAAKGQQPVILAWDSQWIWATPGSYCISFLRLTAAWGVYKFPHHRSMT